MTEMMIKIYECKRFCLHFVISLMVMHFKLLVEVVGQEVELEQHL
jgi:hypothetical protein